MRWLTLYLRCRSVPAAVGAVLGTTATLWSVGHAIDHPQSRGVLALLAVLAGTAATAPGLAGADVDLDRTAAIAWPPRRAAHVVVAGAAVAGIVATTALTGGALTIARDVTGMSGLVALGAATLGAPAPGSRWPPGSCSRCRSPNPSGPGPPGPPASCCSPG